MAILLSGRLLRIVLMNMSCLINHTYWHGTRTVIFKINNQYNDRKQRNSATVPVQSVDRLFSRNMNKLSLFIDGNRTEQVSMQSKIRTERSVSDVFDLKLIV